jgi:hypothetical protein
MPFFAARDRRKHQRASLAAPCPCFFLIRGRRYSAFMVDVSASGAGFRNFEVSAVPGLKSGDTARFDVVTPYGRASYTGEIAWVGTLEGGHGWGLRLAEQLRSGDGPLGSLLEAAFPAN